MRNEKEQSKLNLLWLLLFAFFVLFVSGCASKPVAPDLLNLVNSNSEPLIDNTTLISVEIDPSINKIHLIKESVEESLGIALKKANIFGADSSNPYSIKVNIIEASQSPMSFGMFGNRLKVHYVLFGESQKEILNETIYTEAESDQWYFVGIKRARRAYAVNISKNVLQFVGILQNNLNKNK